MPVREFANQKALMPSGRALSSYGRSASGQLPSPVAIFTRRQRLLSPDQYEIVDVRTSRGVRRAMLFPKMILQARADLPPNLTVPTLTFRARSTTRRTLLWRRSATEHLAAKWGEHQSFVIDLRVSWQSDEEPTNQQAK